MNFEKISEILNSLGGENASQIISALLSFLGLDSEEIASIAAIIPKLLSGELTLKDLLPHALPLLIAYLTKNNNAPEPQKTEEAFETYLKLEPLESFTDDTIYSSLDEYFSQA